MVQFKDIYPRVVVKNTKTTIFHRIMRLYCAHWSVNKLGVYVGYIIYGSNSTRCDCKFGNKAWVDSFNSQQ